MLFKSTIKEHKLSTFQIVTAVVFAALCVVVTMAFVFPIGTTGGYFNLGDTVIYVAALLFGPLVGLIAGAGAAIADIVIAPGYAPITFIVKAVEGFLIGFLIKMLSSKIRNFTLCASIAVLVGGGEMVVGYFIYDSFVMGYAAALLLVPINVAQMLLCLIIAVPILHAVLRVFPRFKNYLRGVQ
ncbi:MAG: ECF transporter S component [Nitrososphaerota archaeon]|jgi:uncharacterized membrane protein|nr:ECF transporter S component [Nitrososphaerota archaeon]